MGAKRMQKVLPMSYLRSHVILSALSHGGPHAGYMRLQVILSENHKYF